MKFKHPSDYDIELNLQQQKFNMKFKLVGLADSAVSTTVEI